MRDLDDKSAKTLRPGADHYTAFVGPPREYDFMAASQFALLFALGLRDHNRLLDFGCGSLRVGRLLIPFLQAGNYFAIEPEQWLIDEALNKQLGRGIIDVKRPTFSNAKDFSAKIFDQAFDFIVAQSIFSHAGPILTTHALKSFQAALAPRGLCVVTFLVGDSDTPEGWHYPQIISYRTELIKNMVTKANLVAKPIPWYHPKQCWWLLAHDTTDLPSDSDVRLLHGRTLRPPEPR